MALLNIFKKKKIKEEKKKTEGELPKVGAGGPVKKGKRGRPGYQILKFPHITEKATDLVERNQHVFKVYPEANKIEIKKAIENIYGVDVISVKIINIPRRKRRLGKTLGWRKGYKKAIVRVKEGQKIEIMPR